MICKYTFLMVAQTFALKRNSFCLYLVRLLPHSTSFTFISIYTNTIPRKSMLQNVSGVLFKFRFKIYPLRIMVKKERLKRAKLILCHFSENHLSSIWKRTHHQFQIVSYIYINNVTNKDRYNLVWFIHKYAITQSLRKFV